MDYSEGWEPGTPACYLDDCRTPRPNHWFTWEIVRSYAEFVNYIRQRGVPKFMSFDHDLADEHQLHYVNNLQYFKDTGIPYTISAADYEGFQDKTGMDCAKWLVDYCLDNDVQMPHYTVHSANPAGAENILGLLNNLQKQQGQQPNGYRTAW